MRGAVATLLLSALLGLGAATCAQADDARVDAQADLQADLQAEFFLAVQLDDAATVGKLLARQVDPNGRNRLGGDTGLVLALREGSQRVFALLLAHPASALEATALNGNTALMMAAYRRNRPAVLALLEKGARVNRAGWSALHYAAAGGDEAIVGILLAHGAAIDAAAPGDLTPLMIAAREGQEAAARLLLAQGADAGRKSGESLTALQIAEHADKPRIAAAIRAAIGADGVPRR